MEEHLKPLVSILMTAFNREKYIAEAIESILSSIYTHFELIIVDDSSSDDTVNIARSYEAKDERIKVYVNEKNLGDYHNRNRAASYATGKYIKYVDSDDMVYPHTIGTMVEAMEKYPDAALGVVSLDEQEKLSYPFALAPAQIYHEHFFKKNQFDVPPTSTIYRTDRFREVGGFSGLRFMGDIELHLKLTAKWPTVRIAPSLVFWRKHDDQEFTYGNTGVNHKVNCVKFRFPLYINEFKKADCPLNEVEVKKLVKLYSSFSAWFIILIALSHKQPSLAIDTYSGSQIKLRDFKNAVIANIKGWDYIA